MLKPMMTALSVLWLAIDLPAQKTLSLDSALQMALSGSYEVQIARSELRAAELQDYAGNAGETPRTSFNLNDNAQLINVTQDLSNGTNISRNGAFANALGANLQVNWTIFNGMRVSAIKGRVREQVDVNANLLRATLQNSVADVMQAYYAVVRQQYYLRVIEQSRIVSEQRKVLAEQRKSAGMANASDVLLAELDLHQRVQAKQTQEMLLRQSQIALLNEINAELDSAWLVADSILPQGDLLLDDILTAVRANPQLAAASAAVRVADQNARSAFANRMPTIQINGGLAYNLSHNNGGFIVQNQSYGPFIGLNANVPLLQRRIFDRQYQIAKQQSETLRLREAQTEDDLMAAAYQLWEAYANSLVQVESERENVERSRQYLDLVIQREKLDAATVLELREAQRSFEEANFRMIDLQYQALMAEVELMRLAGMLVE